MSRNDICFLIRNVIFSPFFCSFYAMKRSHMKERCIKSSKHIQSTLWGLGCFTKTEEMLMDPTIRTGMSHHSFSLRGEIRDVYAELETASFFRWSMKTCRLTSSVRIGAPVSCPQA